MEGLPGDGFVDDGDHAQHEQKQYGDQAAGEDHGGDKPRNIESTARLAPRVFGGSRMTQTGSEPLPDASHSLTGGTARVVRPSL
ncbi:hypothetical protein [Rathayibacter soli]|uniref:hypothetical protein n=1 Tax=Rathayibacter soli TaxID=3144168 RepID=UPI0027E55E9C|nr:hypothetical protein [Glaciibacter superstes]